MIAADARILWRLLRGHRQSADHAADLADFYGDQAAAYDQFRDRLLPGRRELFAVLGESLPPGARLVELGAGTGRNLDWLGERVTELGHADLVDLCAPLLAQAKRRWRDHPQVSCHLADACRWQPQQAADAVVFAYSLTMIPDWRAAIANALAMLRPGGLLAVVDFTVLDSQCRPARIFWKRWFAHDGVRLDEDHTRCLQAALPVHSLWTGRAKIPYLPLLRPAYYGFVGQKT